MPTTLENWNPGKAENRHPHVAYEEKERLFLEVRDQNIRALFGQSRGHSRAQVPRAAQQHRRLSGQIKHNFILP